MVRAPPPEVDVAFEDALGLLAGKDFWTTPGLHKYGIGSLKFSDGPNGVRGEDWTQGAPSACIPCGTSLGATFDSDMVRRVGKLLGNQCKDKSVDVLLGPTMNVHRYALCGRNFESFSEDPVVTGALATAYVDGVQSEGVSACPKHFLGIEAEDGRRWTSSEISEQALHEIYLEPFRKVVTAARPWCLMTAYNAVNGTFCSESSQLISMLREDWNYDGVIVSDWFGTYSTAPAINAGLDLEMPGPSKFRTPSKLNEALIKNDIDRDQLLRSAQRVVTLVRRTGNLNKFDQKADTKAEKESYEARPDIEETLKAAASAGFVLLKNALNTLPLSPQPEDNFLVVGEYAKQPAIHGGGSASLKAPYVKDPLTAIKAQYHNTHYSQGVAVNRLITLPSLDDFAMSDITLAWHNGADNHEEKRFRVETLKETQYMLVEHIPEGLLDLTDFSTRMRFSVSPKLTGTYDVSLCGPGSMKCFMDGELVLKVDSDLNMSTEHYLFDRAKIETRRQTSLALESGKVYEFEVCTNSSRHEMKHVNREFFIQGTRFGLAHADDSETRIHDVLARARTAKNAIVFVGTNSEWESEGFDRLSLTLPGRQNEMVCRVAEACTGKTIVVVNSGSPIDMSPWADKVDGIIQAWFPGMEFGDALCDMLTGAYNPSGRLPTTFADNLSLTAAGDVGRKIGPDNRVIYEEGCFLGYRKAPSSVPSTKPRFAFGHGLSFTDFHYDAVGQSIKMVGPRDCIASIELQVTNVGTVAGEETVLLFVEPLNQPSIRPEIELRAFSKTANLQPGSMENIQLKLDREAFSFWDTIEHCWRVEQGSYQIRFCGRKGVGDWLPTADIIFHVPESFTWS